MIVSQREWKCLKGAVLNTKCVLFWFSGSMKVVSEGDYCINLLLSIGICFMVHFSSKIILYTLSHHLTCIKNYLYFLVFDKSLQYFDTHELPQGWDREELLGEDSDDEEDNGFVSDFSFIFNP